MGELKVLDDIIEYVDKELHIDSLKFLKDNPRVYECTRETIDFENKPEKEQQKIIYEELLDQPSVKNLIPDIEMHGGLLEPILVRSDTMEVVEGNSRLAAYRSLYKDNPNIKWKKILCKVVKKLTDEQQAAYLNQMHVKGKNQWSGYEKANLAYVMHKEKGWSLEKIADLSGVSPATITIRIKVIKMMRAERDTNRSRFSYYDVLVRTVPIKKAIDDNQDLYRRVLNDVQRISNGNNENNDLTARALRKQLPAIIKKPKILRKYINSKIGLEDAYQEAKLSNLTEKAKRARDLLQSVNNRKAVFDLEKKEFGAFKLEMRRLKQTIEKIANLMDNYENN